MYFSIVISATKTNFGPIVFRDNLETNIIKAKNIGFDGIELAVKCSELIDVKKLKNILEEINIKIIAIGTGQIFFDEGLSFSDSDKKIREKAVKRVFKIINIANHFKASLIIGLIRGRFNEGFETGRIHKRILTCLEKCLEYSSDYSTNFLLEPINRYETNIFNTLEETADFLENNKNFLDLKRIGILADTFHMNIEEPSILESIKKHFPIIKHIHFADSNRWCPGYGHINFKEIKKFLEQKNYKNFISFEMYPLPKNPDFSAAEALKYIRNV